MERLPSTQLAVLMLCHCESGRGGGIAGRHCLHELLAASTPQQSSRAGLTHSVRSCHTEVTLIYYIARNTRLLALPCLNIKTSTDGKAAISQLLRTHRIGTLTRHGSVSENWFTCRTACWPVLSTCQLGIKPGLTNAVTLTKALLSTLFSLVTK